MIHTKKTTLMTVVVGCVVGCARSDFALSGREQKPWQRVDEKKLAEALPEEPIKILPETFFYAGQLLESQGQTEFAIRQYRKAVAVNHQYGAAYHRLGLLLSLGGNHEEAIGHLARAVELQPNDPIFRNNYGYELMLHERWAEAEREFGQAVEMDPQFARPYVNRGMALSKLGRFDEALASFRVVLPESDAYYNLGLMHRGQGQYQEAADAFDRVLSINPLFWAARTQLEQLAPRVEGLSWSQVAEAPLPSDPFDSLSPEPQMGMDASDESETSAESQTNWSIFADGSGGQSTDWPMSSMSTEASDSMFSGLGQSEGGTDSYWIPTPYAMPEDFGITTGPPTFEELVASLSIVRNEIDCLEGQTSEYSESSETWGLGLDSGHFDSSEEQACTVPWYMEYASPAWTGPASESEPTTFSETGSRRPTMGMSVTRPDGEAQPEHPRSPEDDESGDDEDDDVEDHSQSSPELRHGEQPQDRNAEEPDHQKGQPHESHGPRAEVMPVDVESAVVDAGEPSIEDEPLDLEVEDADADGWEFDAVELAYAGNAEFADGAVGDVSRNEPAVAEAEFETLAIGNVEDAFELNIVQLETLLSIVENETRCAESIRKSTDSVSMKVNGLSVSTDIHAAVVAMLHRWVEIDPASESPAVVESPWLIEPDTRIPLTDQFGESPDSSAMLVRSFALPAPLPD